MSRYSSKTVANPDFHPDDLQLALKELRKENKFLVRQNYLCCSGCAGYALATMIENKPKEKAEKIRGVVFYHHQDAKSYRDGYNLHLRFGHIDTNKYGVIGIPTVEVGKEIVKVLDRHKVPYVWDGTENETIQIACRIAA